MPTYGEMGFPNVYSGSWVGFFAPAKTPDAVVAKLNAEINADHEGTPEAQQKLKTIGFDAIIKTQAEAADYFKSESRDLGQDDQRDRLLVEFSYRLTTTFRIAVLPPLAAASASCSAPFTSSSFSTRWPWKPKWLPSCSYSGPSMVTP